MNTAREYSWSITEIGVTTAHRTGTASGLTETWTAALAAGRRALLAGQLATLEVSVNGQPDAQHSPGRDQAGRLDPEALTASLVEIHQCVTAHELADRLIAG